MLKFFLPLTTVQPSSRVHAMLCFRVFLVPLDKNHIFFGCFAGTKANYNCPSDKLPRWAEFSTCKVFFVARDRTISMQLKHKITPEHDNTVFGHPCKHYIGVNSLGPRQNRRHFANDVFKCNFLNENVSIPIKISLKFVPKGPINNIPALVQIMDWRRTGDKPLCEPMMTQFNDA